MNFSRCSSLCRNICIFKNASSRRISFVSLFALQSQDGVSRSVKSHHLCLGFQSHFLKHLFCTKVDFQKRGPATNKTWKLSITKSLDVEGEHEQVGEKKHDCCEMGTEAVTHKDVVSVLRQCSTVEEQINELCCLLSLTSEDLENRRKFCQSLFSLLQPYFPNIHLRQFGSVVNGLGFKGCDSDISICLPNMEMQMTKLPVIPSVEDVDSGAFPLEMLEQLQPRQMLRFVRRLLRQKWSDEIQGNILLISARCPVVRFYNKKYNLFCDLSCASIFSLCNSKVLLFVGHMDDRIVPLLKFFRYWGKNADFVGDLDMFNSYSFTLLVLYFLQNTSPPVVPPLSEIVAKSDYLTRGNIDDIDLLLSDMKKFSPSENRQTTDELLREFFFFYMFFDFSQILCPLVGSSVPKAEFKSPSDSFQFSSISIEDPFRSSFNVSAAANGRSCRLFLKNVLAACQLYQDKNAWVPNQNGWGLELLLQKPHLSLIGAAQSYTFKVPLEYSHLSKICNLSSHFWQQKISEALLHALEYGLLFDCTVLKHSKVLYNVPTEALKSKPSCTYNPILNVHCKVRHDIFSGRSNFKQAYLHESITNDILEAEHEISVSVSKLKKEDRTQELFAFQCQCQELQQDELTSLHVTLTFPKNNSHPVVVVLLREYLPRVLDYLISKLGNDTNSKVDPVVASNSKSY